MVQVDVFWSYGIGAGFAYAAQQQLAANPPTKQSGGLLANPYFTRNLLYLATLFGPSGLYLVWEFTSWETMHALDKSMPAWLVTLFAITNVTQGLLGFWATYKLLAAGKRYLAFLQPLLGYFCMFFVLVHGWDGKGYQRFFSEDRTQFESWTPATIGGWLLSPVALTLAAMGVVLIPVMISWMARWMVEGQRALARQAHEQGHAAPARRGYSAAQLGAIMLALVFGAVLGSAILASVLVHQLGWVVGLAGFAVIAAVGIAGPKGLLHAAWRRLDPMAGYDRARSAEGAERHLAAAGSGLP